MSFGHLVRLNNLEITITKITEKGKFLLIATDGVWEFLKNRKITELIQKYYHERDIESACDKLLRISIQKWFKEDDGVDDITFVLVFFN